MKKEIRSFEGIIAIISLVSAMIVAYFWGASHIAAYGYTAVLFGVVSLLFAHIAWNPVLKALEAKTHA